MPLAQVAGMTPHQINHLALHPRDRKGNLRRPVSGYSRARGTTLESELAFLRGLRGWDAGKPQCAKAERALFRKYGRADEWPGS